MYEIERGHHFQQLMMHAHELKELRYKNLSGNTLYPTFFKKNPFRFLRAPVYDTAKDHQFQQLLMHAHELKALMGPVYGVERDSKYVPGDLALNNRTKFKITFDFLPFAETQRVEGQLATTAPVYRGVDAKNQVLSHFQQDNGDIFL